jgi:hypothetical protein
MCKFDNMFVSKIIIFQEALQFKNVISFCYNKQNVIKINGRVPPNFTWHISKIIMHSISPIVNACILKQFNEHWIFFDTLHSTIFMCLKFKE